TNMFNRLWQEPGERRGQRRERRGDEPEKNRPNDNQANAGQRPPADFRAMMAFRRELADFLRSEGAALLLRDSGKPYGMMTVSGSWSGRDRADAQEPLPSAWLPHNHYALLHRLATRPAPARTRLEVEITNKLIPGPITVYNTVGEIVGKDKPDEYVV